VATTLGKPVKSALDDPRRLHAIDVLDLLSSTPSESLDRLTRLASHLLGSPVALVSIVDADRQFFKSHVGTLGIRETPLSYSFCQHVVTSGEPLIVDDCRADDLVKNNLAIEELNVAAYAGVPLVTTTGETLGSFCVIDTKPRHWTPEELEILDDLADAAMVEIELRETSVRLREEQLLREETMNLLVHDFRTPLSIINAAAQTALADESCLTEMLSITLSSTSRMQCLVNDLLDVGRFEAGQLEPNIALFDFEGLVASTVRDLVPLAHEHEITLEHRVSTAHPPVSIDAGLIARVLTNLLSNAIRYTERSSVVVIALENAGTMLRCSVSDSGQGISPDMKDVIFQKYGRVVSAKKNCKTPSTGLGLTFCKMCVESLGGTIGVDSVEGEGSTFWFTVPFSSE
jgi:signal transduction histidine kinase